MKIIVSFLLIILLSSSSYADEAVVAKVNGVAITSRELEEAVDRLIPRSTYHGSVSEEKRAEFREKAFEELVTRELQYQDALARGMKPDKKQVKERMGKIRERFKSKKEYKKALEQAGVTEDQLRARVEKDVLVSQVMVKAVAEPSRMSDADVQEYYDKNTGKFKQPESVKLRLISTKDEKKATEALAKIKAGEDFGNLAAAVSEDQYRVKGGDIGYQHRGKLLPELENAAFQMKTGEIRGLIKAENLWFIIKLEEKKPAHQMTFEEAKDKLKKELEEKRSNELKETWMADLRAKAKIEIVGAVGSRQ